MNCTSRVRLLTVLRPSLTTRRIPPTVRRWNNILFPRYVSQFVLFSRCTCSYIIGIRPLDRSTETPARFVRRSLTPSAINPLSVFGSIMARLLYFWPGPTTTRFMPFGLLRSFTFHCAPVKLSRPPVDGGFSDISQFIGLFS